jgi:aminoglycoside phosphotransferase (APT) family kinase protein
MVQELPPAAANGLISPEVLARVPGCEHGQPPKRIAALPGGKVNTTFRVDTSAGYFVVRLNDAAGVPLGANHEREAHLHRAAGVAGVAPELLYVDDAQRFMIARYVSGRTWEAADFARRERLQALGTQLAALHAISPPSVAPFDLGVIVRAHCTHLSAALPAEREFLGRLRSQAERALALCAHEARAATIIHGDLYHANIIEGERLYLIDWEYSAVADPIFDLACALAYYPAAEPYAPELLAAAGLADRPLALLKQACGVYVFLSFLWYRRRRLNGAVAAEDIAAEGLLLERLQG